MRSADCDKTLHPISRSSDHTISGVVLILVLLVTGGVAQTQQASPAEVLPDGFIRQAYSYQLTPSQRGTPPWRWRVVQGALPPGLALDASGTLAGAPRSPGLFRFTVEAMDSTPRALVETRQYVITVPAPLTVAWTQLPQVTSEGAIAGELEVTNKTGHSVDLTVIVVAVSAGGSPNYPSSANKAFALGYQHFSFDVGAQKIPFSSTVPRDSYVVHADAVAEIADTLEIYRARMQSGTLTVP